MESPLHEDSSLQLKPYIFALLALYIIFRLYGWTQHTKQLASLRQQNDDLYRDAHWSRSHRHDWHVSSEHGDGYDDDDDEE
jgi:hypothetical protein